MRMYRLCIVALLAAAPAGMPSAIHAAPAEQAGGSSAVLKSADTDTPGVVAEVIECSRKDGVLSIKVRLRNTSASAVRMTLIKTRNFDAYYLTAGSKKYYVLRDTDKVPLAPAVDNTGTLSVQIAKGGSYTWWGKYPAPPASETTASYFTPLGAPIDDIPISGS